MNSSARRLLAPVLVLLFFSWEVVPQSSSAPLDLTPYRVQRGDQEADPTGFQLNFSGEAGHRLQFHYAAAEPVELEVSVGFPAGGARTERRLLDPGAEDAAAGFDLGPLLGHGPYRPLPAPSHKGPQERVRGYLRTGWWIDTHDPGNYLVTVKGRRVRDGVLLFSNDFRLPVQTWIGADPDRLAYIDDNAAEVELWLKKGAPVRELAVEVDLVEARTGRVRSPATAVRLTQAKAHAAFDLTGLKAATYHVRVRPRVDGRLWEDGPRRALYLHRNGPAPRPEPPLEIPVAPQLFVDDFLIEDQRNLRRIFHPARKLDHRPLIRPDRPWEGHSVMLPAGAVPAFNREQQRYELEYMSATRYRLLAVSNDGVRWTKPKLGLVEFQGSRANNILEKMPSRGHLGEEDEFGGLWDYRTRGTPDLRTATRVGSPKYPDMEFQRGTYLMVRDSEGVRYLTTERPFMRTHLQVETLDSPTDNLGPMFYDERTGELVLYFAAHPPSMGRALVRYDNKWAVSRNLGRLTTRDGVNWNRSYIWAPPREHPKHQSYGMQRVKRIGDLYVAFFPLYDCGTQRMAIHLWVSRNGIHWEDLGGDQAWIPNGPDGSFDYGIVYGFAEGSEEGDRSVGLYHGTNTLHVNAWIRDKLVGGGLGDTPIPASGIFNDVQYNGRPYLSPPAPVGPAWALYECIWSWRRPHCSQTVEEVRQGFWAELKANTGQTREDHIEKSRVFQIAPAQVEYRTNGFASRRAGEREAVLTTHPLIFEGSRLTVNAAAAKGRVIVEILDEGGRPLAGYGRDECMLAAFDSTRQDVTWKEKPDLASLRGRAVRLRFHLQRADLYGFQIQ